MNEPNWAEIANVFIAAGTAIIVIGAGLYALYRWARPLPPQLNIILRPAGQRGLPEWQSLTVLEPNWGSATIKEARVGKGLEIALLQADEGFGEPRPLTDYGSKVRLALEVRSGQSGPSSADLFVRPRASISSVRKAQMFVAFRIAITSPLMRDSTQRVALDMSNWAESAPSTNH